MGLAVTFFGRNELAWDQMREAGEEFLVERARLARLTPYTELNTTLKRRTGLPGLDFSRQDERAAMGHLLGMIVERNRPDTGLMISALVTYLDAKDAWPGFYALPATRRPAPRRFCQRQPRLLGQPGQGTPPAPRPQPAAMTRLSIPARQTEGSSAV
jgi:hypothetical protein